MSNDHGSKWIRPAKRLAIYHRDGFACVYCGATVEAGAVLSLDHVRPRELGGGHQASNLVTACIPCNSARQELPMKRWLATLADKGRDPVELAARVRRQTRRVIDIATGKALLEARRGTTTTNEEG